MPLKSKAKFDPKNTVSNAFFAADNVKKQISNCPKINAKNLLIEGTQEGD